MSSGKRHATIGVVLVVANRSLCRILLIKRSNDLIIDSWTVEREERLSLAVRDPKVQVGSFPVRNTWIARRDVRISRPSSQDTTGVQSQLSRENCQRNEAKLGALI